MRFLEQGEAQCKKAVCYDCNEELHRLEFDAWFCRACTNIEIKSCLNSPEEKYQLLEMLKLHVVSESPDLT
jgi:ribosomal protein L37AE/L43A